MCMNFKQGALGQRLITDKEPLTSPRGHIRATQVIRSLRGLEEQWATSLSVDTEAVSESCIVCNNTDSNLATE